MILEHQHIEQQDLDSCEKLLKQCLKNKDIDLELVKHPELWSQVDALANTICWLEDRIKYLETVANLEKANAARWGKV